MSSVNAQNEKLESYVGTRYRRRFLNTDGASCWLNSCLQLFLSALDRLEDTSMFISELGCELLKLKNSTSSELESQLIKHLITSTEILVSL